MMCVDGRLPANHTLVVIACKHTFAKLIAG